MEILIPNVKNMCTIPTTITNRDSKIVQKCYVPLGNIFVIIL